MSALGCSYSEKCRSSIFSNHGQLSSPAGCMRPAVPCLLLHGHGGRCHATPLIYDGITTTPGFASTISCLTTDRSRVSYFHPYLLERNDITYPSNMFYIWLNRLPLFPIVAKTTMIPNSVLSQEDVRSR